ncbi:MAG: hypothetical protein LUC45_06510 [Paraprevotella sp.]|nr:hypothetical protein [Paraprevotella sp.]
MKELFSRGRGICGTCGIGMGLVLWAFLCCSCSVGRLFHDETVRCEAMVLMNDSTKYVGKTLLPHAFKSSLRFVTADGKRIKLKSDRVARLVFRQDSGLVGMFIYAPYVSRAGQRPGRDVDELCGQRSSLEDCFRGQPVDSGP